ncbi:MAG: hypothetical protein HKN90_05890 [Flavobacteriaceae bacterium]|nr:hypothetical protein [Flavobacteriaceae bacterium]
MDKQAIIKRIMEEQEGIIKSLDKVIKLYKTTADIDEDNTLDPEDYSHQAEAQEMRLRYEQRLKGEQQKLSFLESSLHITTDIVKSGALIETDLYYFFIGLSIHPIKMDAKQILCVSEKAPVAQQLMGKQVGDFVTIGDKEIEIKDIK